MAGDQENRTIAGAANACLLSFAECMRQLNSFGPRERAMVQNQLGRFSLWTDNIGVYAPARASIDYRLREVDDIHRVLRGLLEALQSNLNDCITAIEAWNVARLSTDEPENEEKNLHDIIPDFERVIQVLTEDIRLLHQLSNTIRKAGRESQNSKSATLFEIKDSDGTNMEDALVIAFKRNLSDQFPNVEDWLIARLASAMILRRKRILYRRSRRPKVAKHVPEETPEPELSIATPDSVIGPLVVIENTDQARESQEHIATIPHKPRPSVIQSQAKTTTTLDLEKLRQASTPSVISGTKAISFRLDDNLVFPPAPRASIRDRFKRLKAQRKTERDNELSRIPNYTQYIADKAASMPLAPETASKIEMVNLRFHLAVEEDRKECDVMETEVICPYCLEALSSGKMKSHRKWREHLQNDLDSYVCLFPDCRDSETLYSRSEQWLAHMKQHALRWRCRAKSHVPQIFTEKSDYEEHMKFCHREAFSDAQLPAISERNARTIGPLFSSCPLCGLNQNDDDFPSSLEAHIVGHLRFIALKSLPLIEEEIDDGDSSRLAASDDSAKPSDRSTLRELMDHDTQLSYDTADSGTQVKKPFMLLDQPVNANAFAPWGGLEEYVRRFYAHPVERMSSEAVVGSAGSNFRHPYSEWDDDGIEKILKNVFNNRPEPMTMSRFSGERLNKVLRARVAEFASSGCPECGIMDINTSPSKFATHRHLLLHGDPEWFADTHGWTSSDPESRIRDMQWGKVLDSSSRVYDHEKNDPVLQGFLRQVESERTPTDMYHQQAERHELVPAFEDDALRNFDSPNSFVPSDVLESHSGASFPSNNYYRQYKDQDNGPVQDGLDLGASQPSASASTAASGSRQDDPSHQSTEPIHKRDREKEDDDKDERRSHERTRLNNDKNTAPKRLACPYFKNDPENPRLRRSCSGPGWGTVHRLKEHLDRNHALPPSCVRCYTAFQTEADRDTHMRLQNQCQVRERPGRMHGFDAAQKEQLRSRPRGYKHMSETQKWCHIYIILFPETASTDVPSPYYEFDSFRDSGHPVDPMTEYENFLRHEMPDRVRHQLELRIEEGLNPLEETLRGQIVNIVRDVQLELFQSFRASTGPTRPNGDSVQESASIEVDNNSNKSQDEEREDTDAQDSTLVSTSTEPPGRVISNQPSSEEQLEAWRQAPPLDFPFIEFDDFDGTFFDFGSVIPTAQDSTYGTLSISQEETDKDEFIGNETGM